MNAVNLPGDRRMALERAALALVEIGEILMRHKARDLALRVLECASEANIVAELGGKIAPAPGSRPAGVDPMPKLADIGRVRLATPPNGGHER